jgi:hypothetical protein
MKTDDLIAAMAADVKSVGMPIRGTLALAVALGALAASVIFIAVLGTRPDLASAFASPRFLFKLFLTGALLIAAVGLVWNLARPGSVPHRGWILALAAVPAMLAAASAAEMLIVSPAEWEHRVLSPNWMVCMVLIPMLAATPLAAMILALRRGATTNPVMAGAAAGLVAAGIGATLYATHCQSDSPLFVAVWYVIATAIVTLAGALLGDRFLRW